MALPRIASETNGASITTSASGAGTFTAAVLQQIEAAVLSEENGYVLKVTGITGQNVAFQVKETSSLGGTLVDPTSAITFDPGTITMLETGY
jgi:hypothetical protein